MNRLRFCLTLSLALLWLASEVCLPASGTAAVDSAVLVTPSRSSLRIATQARTIQPGRMPDGFSAAGWRAIQSQVAKLTADDGAEGDEFGYSVSLDGDTAVVGARFTDVGGHRDQGAAYVFYRDQGGPDAWGLTARLIAADGLTDDHFGSSVSIGGDTVVVGATLVDVGGNAYCGAVYVFYRDQGGPDAWGQVAKLTVGDGGVSEVFFGSSVSVSGDTAIVGAWKADVGGNLDQGTAYVFYRDQGGANAWGQVAKLTGADSKAYDAFGIGVSLSGDIAIVGAWNARIGGSYGQGTAYIFARDQDGADAWGQVAKLTAVDGGPDDNFGYSVAVNGDTAVVGAPWADQGAAYVFYRNQGGADAWGQVSRLSAADGVGGDRFGWSVSAGDDTAIVGMLSSGSLNVNPGTAYLFYRDLDGTDAWGQAARLTAADGVFGDCFGISVFVSGHTAVVGASGADNARGAAYIHVLPPGTSGDQYTTPEDTPLEISAALGVLADDVDPQGDPLTAVLDAAPSHGTLDLHADGSFVYTPTANIFGLDSFLYYANDGAENSDVATVNITVTAVNDAPAAVDDAYRTPIGWRLAVRGPGVLLNDGDVDNDLLTAVLDSGPSHGTLDLNTDGSFTYTPAAGFAGVDTFTYHANDGQENSSVATVRITVAGHRICLPLVVCDG